MVCVWGGGCACEGVCVFICVCTKEFECEGMLEIGLHLPKLRSKVSCFQTQCIVVPDY